MIGLLFTLVVLPFRVLFLVLTVCAELLDHSRHQRRRHGGRRRGYARRGPSGIGGRPQVSTFWKIVCVLLVIGVVRAFPAVAVGLAALGLAALLLLRRQDDRRETEARRRRDEELDAQRAHANLMAALHPEDIEWLRSAGWRPPGERRTSPLAG